jgi:hypothetical protein
MNTPELTQKTPTSNSGWFNKQQEDVKTTMPPLAGTYNDTSCVDKACNNNSSTSVSSQTRTNNSLENLSTTRPSTLYYETTTSILNHSHFPLNFQSGLVNANIENSSEATMANYSTHYDSFATMNRTCKSSEIDADIPVRTNSSSGWELRVVGLFGVTGVYPMGRAFIHAAELAVEDINSRPDVLPGYTLVLEPIDTEVCYIQ